MNVNTAVAKFVKDTDHMAQRYGAKVSISVPGEKEVVISDHLPVKTDETTTLMSLEDMAKNNVTAIESHKQEIKSVNEMIQSTLLNDPQYQEKLEQVNGVKKELKVIKSGIMGLNENKVLSLKLQQLRAEKKELTEAQSEYLREYERLSGSTQLELFDGTVMEIVKVCKLVRIK